MNPIEQIWKPPRSMGFRNEVFHSLADVVDRLCDTIIQSEISNGIYVAENEMTVGDWMDEWYECFTSGVKESSRARYAQDIRNHIRLDIGSIHLQDLSLSHVQRFLNKCKEKKHLALKSFKTFT